jgi:hypothetical protein
MSDRLSIPCVAILRSYEILVLLFVDLLAADFAAWSVNRPYNSWADWLCISTDAVSLCSDVIRVVMPCVIVAQSCKACPRAIPLADS